MDSHGYIVDHEAFAMRRGNPQTTNIHMTQQVATKVAPVYDGRTSFLRIRRRHRRHGAASPNWKPRKEAKL